MIKVADCIMGSGKSQAAITFINENADRKFIYITPYLEEATRIRNGCPAASFIEPSDKLSQFHFSKSEHSAFLISQGRNITSTHSLFRHYTPAMLDSIRANKYTLIVDESLDVMTEANYSSEDIRVLEEAGYITKDENGVLTGTGKEYKNGALRDLVRASASSNLIELDYDDKTTKKFYWSLPAQVLEAFEEVIVLTYLFQAQDLSYYMELNGIGYQNLYVNKCEDGLYRFFDTPQPAPEYVKTIKDRIHIFDDKRYHDRYLYPFRHRYSVSENYIKTNDDGAARLKSCLRGYLKYIYKDTPNENIMWGSFNAGKIRLRGGGYSSQFVPFNSRATNKYRHKKVLAYIANVFQNPTKANYLGQLREGGYDNDAYALSTMIQWIWRSAIRDGQEIWIYIPSKRMRDLLIDWMNKLQEEAMR